MRLCATSCAGGCAWCWPAAWQLMDAEQARWSRRLPRLLNRSMLPPRRLTGTGSRASTALTERGYELDREGQERRTAPMSAAVELERAIGARTQQHGARCRAGDADCGGRRSWNNADAVGRHRRGARRNSKQFLETAAGEARAFRQKVEARQQEARAAAEEVFCKRSASWKPTAATRCTC
jgi:chromosome segregation protein